MKINIVYATILGTSQMVAEDLEDAQETCGYLVQSENNKMTEIDRLKARIAELERRQ